MTLSRALLAAAVASATIALSGCAIAPGSSARDMTAESATLLPTRQGDDMVPANVKVRPISANLIIEQERAQRGEAPQVERAATAQPRPVDPNLQHLDYKLGPGDIISVTVWDHPELTIPAGSYRSAELAGTLVGEDGNIFYPYAGVLKAAGLTVREVRDQLAKKLASYIEKVQLDVRVVSFRSKRVYVVGEVNKPGLQPIDDIPMTMLEAVNRAGGFSAEADHSNVLLTRRGETFRVDLQALYEQGQTAENIRLESGDIVNVPDRQQNKVFVLGEVQRPGGFVMNKRRITLAEALGEAGFANQLTANPGFIFVMRGTVDAPEIYHLDARSPDALILADRFPLRPRDIVYVDVAEVVRWNRVITNILPTATLLNTVSQVQYPLFNGRQGQP
jgi:polysaccharide export outer membrane protein